MPRLVFTFYLWKSKGHIFFFFYQKSISYCSPRFLSIWIEFPKCRYYSVHRDGELNNIDIFSNASCMLNWNVQMNIIERTKWDQYQNPRHHECCRTFKDIYDATIVWNFAIFLFNDHVRKRPRTACVFSPCTTWSGIMDFTEDYKKKTRESFGSFWGGKSRCGRSSVCQQSWVLVRCRKVFVW